MKLYLLCHHGLEKQIGLKDSITHPQVVEVETTKEESLNILRHSQLARRILIGLGIYKNIDEISIKNLSNFFSKDNVTFKIEVEGVKGQENRFEIAKTVGKKIFDQAKQESLKIDLDYKEPHLKLIIFFNGEKYFVGFDMVGKEINSRNYRLFTSSASFKGDLACSIITKCDVKKNEKILFGYVKDGTLLIETALKNYNLPVTKLHGLDFNNFPMFKGIGYELETHQKPKEITLFGFDENIRNINASRKNSKLAGVSDYIKLSKISLDEIDVKFDEKGLDKFIFLITKKDESKINEIYYQASYVLNKGGLLCFIAREQWEISIHSKFELVKKEEIIIGESIHQLLILKRI